MGKGSKCWVLLVAILLVHLSANSQWIEKSYFSEDCKGVLLRGTSNITFYGERARSTSNFAGSFSAPIQAGTGTLAYPILNCLDATKDPLSTLNMYVGKGFSTGQTNLLRAGSSTWQTVTALANIRQVEFFNDTFGYVSGQGIKKTINRSQTWTDVILPAPVSTIIFNKLIAPARNVVYASGDSVLIKSFDQGDTWQIDTFPQVITSIGFLNADTGYVTTDGGAVYKTLNAGLDWTLLHQLPNRVYKDVAVLNADTVFIAGDDIYRSIDGGQTWYRQLNKAVNIVDISFTGMFGVAIDSFGRFWYSSNLGGATGQYANDAGGGITRLGPLQNLYCPGQYDLVTDIRNYGSDTLRSVYLVVNVNTTGQSDTIHWTGTILPGDMRSNYYLGSYYLENDTNKVSVSTYMPNGVLDENSDNDTVTTNFIIKKLLGTYTVGTGGDYISIHSAFVALIQYNHCGPVVFDLLPGHHTIYNATLRGTGNTGPNATITVRSATGNPNDVTVSDSSHNQIYPILTLDNIRYVNFEGITFKSFRSTPNKIFVYTQGAGDVVLKNCKFEVVPTSTGRLGFGPAVGSTKLLGSLTVDSCEFKNGGGLVASVTDICEVSNCTAYDSRLLFTAADSGNIHHNTLFGASALELTSLTDGAAVHHNAIYGGFITINGGSLANADTVFVYNNYINTTRYTNASVEVLNGGKAYIANNTLVKDTLGALINLYSLTTQPNCKAWVFNNIIQHTGNDRVYDGGLGGGNFIADHNVLMGKDSILNRSSISNTVGLPTYFTLERWQSLLGIDVHSYYQRVTLDSNSYRIQPYQNNVVLNANGTPLAFVTHDIEGNPRDANTPDIGAYEFDLPAFDAAIVAAMPAGQMCVTTQEYFVKVLNLGTTVIDSLRFGWSLNGHLKTSVSFSTPLQPGDTSAWVYLGDSATLSGVTYNLIAWLETVNGIADMSAVNDTLRHSVLARGLAGSYTIGGTGANYSTIQAAIQALQTNGVCDNVTFTIAPGTYNLTQNPTIIPYIAGADSTRRIVFHSQTLDSTSVIISGQYLHLTGTKYLTFDHVGFATNVWFEGGASYNTFANCHFNFHATTALNLRTNAVTQPFDGNLFINNYFLRTVVDWNGSALMDHGNKFIGNKFINRDCSFTRQQGLIFHNNIVLDTITNYNPGLNIIVSFGNNFAPISITNNQVHSKYFSGMSVETLMPPSINNNGAALDVIDSININNNSISTEQGNALSVTRGSIYNNTLRSNGYGKTLILSGTGKVKNNIIVSHAGSVAARYFSNTLPHLLEADNNVYYGGDTIIIGQHTNFSSIYNYHTASGQDAHSITHQPNFLNATGYEIDNDYRINNIGTPIPGIPMDIDGEVRNMQSPDPGADEFDIVRQPVDAAISGILNSTVICPLTPVPLSVDVTNYGINNITGLSIKWTLNGVSQPKLSWAGNIEIDSVKTLTVGTFNFTEPIAHTIQFIIDSVNGAPSNYRANDTLVFASIYTPLNGSYSVWGANADFANITDAVSYLQLYGVCGPVDLNIAPNTYAGGSLAFAIIKDTIRGANAQNTITLQSATGRASDVLIDDYEIELDGVSHIRIKHLSFTNSCDSYGAIKIHGDCKNITIDSCKFTCTSYYPTTSASYAITLTATGTLDSLFVTNNRFTGGAMRLLYGHKNLWFAGNTIIDPYYHALHVDYTENLHIYANTLLQNTWRAGYAGKGIYSVHSSGSIVVDNNLVQGGFVNGIELNNNPQYDSYKVRNNVVNGDTTMGYGIIITTNGVSTGIDSILYNTISLQRAAAASSALDLRSTTLKVVRNNILAHFGGGFSHTYYSNNRNTDYNILYSTGPYLYKYKDTTYTSQAAVYDSLGIEMHSTVFDPQFISATDLHFLSDSLLGRAVPIAGLYYDIQGILRDPFAPNPGAYEIVPPVVYDSINKDIEVVSIENDTLLMGSQSLSIRFTLNDLLSTSAYYQYIGVLDSVYLSYSVNDTFTATEIYRQPVQVGDSIVYTFSTPFNIPKGRAYALKAWAGLPAGLNDVDGLNDTATLQLVLPMAGIYTVYGQYPDFLNIKHAMASLDDANSSGSVIFDIREGSDTTSNTFKFIGSDNHHQITYRSASGNPSDVKFRVTDIREAYNVKLENITILSHLNTAYMYTHKGIDVYACTNFEVNGCVVIGNFNRNNNNGFSLVACNGSKFINTKFVDFSMAISYGGTPHAWLEFDGAHIIEGCTFENTTNGIWTNRDWYGVDSFVVRNCTMEVSGRGIELKGETQHHIKILDNHIKNTVPGYGILITGIGGYIYGWILNNWLENGVMQFNNLTSSNGVFNNFLVANNFIGFGMHLNGNPNVNSFVDFQVAHNSVMEGFRLDGLNSVELINNSFTGLNHNPALTLQGSIFEAYNNNAYRAGSAPFAVLPNDSIANDSSFYARYPNMVDYFFTTDPMHISANDLHIRPGSGLLGGGTGISGLPYDIDGDVRDQNAPDVGADEYTTPPVFYDVHLLPLITAGSPCTNGDISIRLMNNGTLPVTNAEIVMQLNGSSIDTLAWNGSLQPGDTSAVLTLSTVNFVGGQQYQLKAFLLDTGNMDAYPYNDTVTEQFNFAYNLLSAPGANNCGHILFGTDTSFTTYQWSTGETTDSILVSTSGTYSLTITDQFGCTVTDSQVVNVIPPVAFDVTVTGASCGVADGSIQLSMVSGTAPFVYNWYPVQSTTSAMDSVATGFYLVAVEDVNGCIADSVILVGNNCQEVWPGDANTDGIVDVEDFIYICIGEGYTGPVRSNATINWVGEPAQDWNYTLAQSNLKHLDTDGDGNVAFGDSMAVLQNYGLTHMKTGNEGRRQVGAPKVYLNIREASATNGDVVNVDVFAAEGNLPLDSAFALALTLLIDNNLLQPTLSVNFLDNSWLGNAVDLASIQKPQSNTWSIGVSRHNGVNVSGHGLIGTFAMKVPDDLGVNTAVALTTVIDIDNAKAFNNLAEPLPLDWAGDSLIINAHPVAVSELGNGIKVLLHPNPVEHMLQVNFAGLHEVSLTVYDLLGNKVHQSKATGDGATLDCTDWAAGLYVLEVGNSMGKVQLKFIKTN